MFHYTESKPKINTYCFFKLSSRRIRTDDLGVEVILVDYNNLEVFIPITEINRKKFNITTFFKPNIIYPGIIASIENERINISYSKIKEEKREKLLKTFEIQTKIANIITNLKKNFINASITNPIMIDFVDNDYNELVKLYENILLNPEQLTPNDEIQKYIIDNRKLSKPIYEQHFILTILETNGIEVLKSILNEINNEYRVKIISSPLYAVEFDDLSINKDIYDKIEKTIKDINCLFEMKELITVKELEVTFS
jgi:translation initiation factor 2 alpha subunit (eIF-2alpha)